MRTFYLSIIPALWVIWLAYWTVSAVGGKETVRRETRLSRLGHGGPMLAGALLLGGPYVFARVLDQRFHAFSFTWFLVGVALTAIGIAFSITARAWLGGNWSGTVTLKQGHELIRNGPYALVRHPIYTGMLLALFGTALVIDRWRALIGFVILAAGLLYKMRVEERFMAEQFGDAYARYRAEVPALIPFLV
jgi:protein-S-isoprenylcysteine O-methyltransferase Ste14